MNEMVMRVIKMIVKIMMIKVIGIVIVIIKFIDVIVGLVSINPPVMLNLIDYPSLKLIELMIIIVKIIMNNIVKMMVIK